MVASRDATWYEGGTPSVRDDLTRQTATGTLGMSVAPLTLPSIFKLHGARATSPLEESFLGLVKQNYKTKEKQPLEEVRRYRKEGRSIRRNGNRSAE